MMEDLKTLLVTTCVLLGYLVSQVSTQSYESCADGSRCEDPEFCCQHEGGCCTSGGYYYSSWSIWNMWYFWFIIIFVLLSCFGGCGYWRRRQWAISQRRRQGPTVAGVAGVTHTQTASPGMTAPNMYAYDFGPQSVYQPPLANPAATFQAPPAYTEVISKPDVYPPNKEDCPPYPGFTAAEGVPYPMANPVGPPAYTTPPPGNPPSVQQQPPQPPSSS